MDKEKRQRRGKSREERFEATPRRRAEDGAIPVLRLTHIVSLLAGNMN
jgi:hypothetical protein